jgi:hypothetical protein
MNGGGKGSWFVVLERFGGIKVAQFTADKEADGLGKY